MRFREIEKIVLNDGWELVDVRGSHHQYKHPTKTGKVTIPNHRGDIPQRVVNSILKQAGLRCDLPPIKERSVIMNYIYPAVFYPEDDGKYSVIFPDLNDLATYGDNLADAFAMAQEACGQYLFTSLRDGDVLPAPTPLDAVEKDEDAALVNLICVNLDEYARAYNDKAVKKTLSIPAWLNTACENYGINYSKVLQDALIAKIQARS